MERCYTEHRRFSSTTDLAAHLARHLQVRQSLGRAVIIADQPIIFLSGLRKHWLKMILAVKRERSRTLDSDLIAELSRQIELMEDLRFSARPAHLSKNADVRVIEPSQLQSVSAECYSVYLCAPIADKEFETYKCKLPTSSVVVDYVSN